MKKSKMIFISILLLASITASSFAIYKSTLNGTINAECAQVIVEIITQESSTQNINPDNLTIEYDFTVNNYITEENTTKRNQLMCNYYIKIDGLSNSIFNDVTLYYLDSNNNNAAISLSQLTEGTFAGYYNPVRKLTIDNNTQDNYKLVITIPIDDLANLSTTVNIDIGYEQFITDEMHVNAPELTTGLIPVIYDELNDNWVKTSSDNENWYNYKQKRWANVVTALNNYNGNSSYIDAPDGTAIPYSDITTMFVWIPRFVYRIDSTYYHKNVTDEGFTNPPIEIHFSKTQDTGGDEWDENIIVVNSGVSAEDCKDSWTTNTSFQFGDTYLNGIWAAKFQANVDTNSNEMYIKPAVLIKEETTIDDSFKYCRNMEKSSLYGWSIATGNLQSNASFENDNNGIDTHLIKNSEWAVLAFFTHSKYGLGQINIETSEKSDYAGQSINTAEIFGTKLEGQSSTGNPYGVYDLASQIWDMVAAYIGPGNNVGAPILYNADSKYKNEYIIEGQTIDYSSKDSVYAIFEQIKDAAIWEVSTTGNNGYSSWFSGRSNIGNYTGGKYKLLITRGGSYKVGEILKNSIFAFGYGHGADLEKTRAFRPVLAVHSGI